MSVPTTMRAVGITAPGGPDVLALQTRPLPVPGPNEVLIEVDYAGVNRHDCGQRTRGHPPPGATDIPGLEVSGRIAALGAGDIRWRVGEQACALVNGGGYADYCIADVATVMPLPAGFDTQRAATLPEALFTAWLNLFELGRLRPGDWFLLHGGASGVGTIALQLARAFGVNVVTTSGSDDKVSLCLSLGAHRAINYKTTDFVAAVHAATAGRGADMILDMAGGLYAERNLHALAPDGRIVHLTAFGEPRFNAPLELIMRKRATITGAMLRGYPLERKAWIASELLRKVWPMLGTKIHPVLDSVFALEDARRSHERVESGAHTGKVLLSVG